MSQHFPVADVVEVRLSRCEKPLCLGLVVVNCPYCQVQHVHRVFDNDTIVFCRTAPCSTETDVRKYSVSLEVTVPKRDVSQPHLCTQPAKIATTTLSTRLKTTGLSDAVSVSEQQCNSRPD